MPGGRFGELLRIGEDAGHDRGQVPVTCRTGNRAADHRLVPSGPHHSPIDSVWEPCTESRRRAAAAGTASGTITG
ncbi:hypothetical protein SNE510_27450 [Streptomyces sp. NE5-10]|nr:hypothetical protein SNE510_27450 [Streptomyces sp. NE5-10]